jgi:hypothetical protein
MTEQTNASITIDFLIEHLSKPPQQHEEEVISEEPTTITHYNNDVDITDILDIKLQSNKYKILKGMLKEELVQILLKFHGTNTNKTTLRKKKVDELVKEILDNDISLE